MGCASLSGLSGGDAGQGDAAETGAADAGSDTGLSSVSMDAQADAVEGDVDGGSSATDASVDAPAETGGPLVLAVFAFIVNGVEQKPLMCPSERWEFPPPPTDGGALDVVIRNVGTVSIAYIARAGWAVGSHYIPGVPTGDTQELTGVLDPGRQVDISSVYAGGITALLGSADPFSAPDAGTVTDEGVIPWPSGVSGGNGATQMQLAEIEVRTSCMAPVQVW